MKVAFKQPLFRIVTLKHGVSRKVKGKEGEEGEEESEETLELRLRPCPAGFLQQLERQFPPPTQFINSKEVPLEGRAQREYLTHFNLAVLGWQLSDQVAAQFPSSTAKREEWMDYGTKLMAEFVEAGFSEGDLQHLYAGALALNNGVGTLGKAD